MLSRIKIHPIRILVMLFIACLLLISISCHEAPGTTQPTSMASSTVTTSSPVSTIFTALSYRLFELKPDDVRFSTPEGFVKPSLFSFEYPEMFDLNDLNNAHDTYFNSEISYFEFIYHQDQVDLREAGLDIIIQKLGYMDDYTPQDVIETLKDFPNQQNIEEGTITVAGFEAKYLKYFRQDPKTDAYPAQNLTLRTVVFSYHGNIWNIRFSWQFYGTEPPEVEQYFKHVIETFKFLDVAPTDLSPSPSK